MAKGDDAIRKKLRKDDRSSSAVTARVASIIASKKRRQSGKRRKCQGMCFSLPTLEDPFNDRNGKKDLEKVTKKAMHKDEAGFLREKCKEIIRKNEKAKNLGLKMKKVTRGKEGEEKKLSVDSTEVKIQTDSVNTEALLSGPFECPSKYLLRCLTSIENSLRSTGDEVNSRFFASTWGVQFWKIYSVGMNILDSSGASSTSEKIAWIVSTAADSITKLTTQKVHQSPVHFFCFLLHLRRKPPRYVQYVNL